MRFWIGLDEVVGQYKAIGSPSGCPVRSGLEIPIGGEA